MIKSLAIGVTALALASSLHAQSDDEKSVDHSTMDHAAHMKIMADSQRQEKISQRAKDVMPFSLAATTHIFSKSVDGGVQRVVAKKVTDKAQATLVRQHLHQIREEFLKGDFSGPTHIHGQSMPGLVDLRAAKPGQIAIYYREVKGGAELIYRSKDAILVSALHQWFDAQLSDHGKDAEEGHDHTGDIKKP